VPSLGSAKPIAYDATEASDLGAMAGSRDSGSLGRREREAKVASPGEPDRSAGALPTYKSSKRGPRLSAEGR